MPELPEVETVRTGLVPLAVGREISHIEVFHPRTARYNPEGLAAIHGQRITALARRGKYLWFETPGELALVAHLGMSGQFRVGGELRHRRASLFFTDGVQLDFSDQRTFGYLRLAKLVPTADGLSAAMGTTRAAVPENVAHIGRDLIDPAFDLAAVTEKVLRKNTEIKRVLLDQTVAAGIGNIYADEALFAAQIHPQRNTRTLTADDIARIYQAAHEVLRAALQAGGTSFDALYVNVNGESGYFERSLQVYGREGQPCVRCGHPVSRITFMNRSSHICASCQLI
ncbi:MAG: bifunctional DNA-formamidopyrimidine glycosylase/DNA-(apurinic or apyrimidinic site) lyase [Trueperella sp.]|nr:bifunctional DNA-formamidopyrimidine glycosylase/DNA-(apurinic or apyrimidinic site) lyase [Trueperella sp.]